MEEKDEILEVMFNQQVKNAEFTRKLAGRKIDTGATWNSVPNPSFKRLEDQNKK